MIKTIIKGGVIMKNSCKIYKLFYNDMQNVVRCKEFVSMNEVNNFLKETKIEPLVIYSEVIKVVENYE